jgi:hypothetical protein
MKSIISNRLSKINRVHLLMIGVIAIVAGIVGYFVLTTHGPAICTNAQFCG